MLRYPTCVWDLLKVPLWCRQWRGATDLGGCCDQLLCSILVRNAGGLTLGGRNDSCCLDSESTPTRLGQRPIWSGLCGESGLSRLCPESTTPTDCLGRLFSPNKDRILRNWGVLQTIFSQIAGLRARVPRYPERTRVVGRHWAAAEG